MVLDALKAYFEEEDPESAEEEEGLPEPAAVNRVETAKGF